MWYSINDKWDLTKHDAEKRPRKFKSTFYLVLILIAVFLCLLSPIEGRLHNALTESQYNLFYMIIFLLVALACAAFSVIKYIKNDGEVDVSLWICFALFVIAMIVF